MEQIFVYGTLKNPSVQKKAFGKRRKGIPDVLKNYIRSKTKIHNKTYSIIIKKQGRYVRGLLLSVSRKELQLIDAYETRAYRRRSVVLRSGKRAWAYVK